MARILGDKRYNSDCAIDLLHGTACVETSYKYLKQLKGGPALGFFQMEPRTFDSVRHYIMDKGNDFANKLSYCIYNEMYHPFPVRADEMIWNLRLQVVMARMKYWQVKEPIPFTVKAKAEYWKKYYNTFLGQGTVEDYIKKYRKVEWYAPTSDS